MGKISRLSLRALAVGLVVMAGITAAESDHASAASCTARSCPAVMTNVNGWNGPSIKPGSLYMGSGDAPYLTKLRWTTYKHTKAVAHGTLHAVKAGCSGPSCRYYATGITIDLGKTKFHCGTKIQGHCTGGWYYSVMRWNYSYHIHLSAQTRWTVRSNGYWQ